MLRVRSGERGIEVIILGCLEPAWDLKHCKIFKRFGELSWTRGYSPRLNRVGLVKKSLAKQKGYSSLKIVMDFFVFSI